MNTEKSKLFASIAGVFAVFFWATTIGVSRTIAENIGPLTSGAVIFLLAGVIGSFYRYILAGKISDLKEISGKYLGICGTLFVLYMIFLYLAIGLASSRQQVIEVGVINYLWPGLTLALSLPILGRKAGYLLLPGLLIASSGIILATFPAEALSFESFWERLSQNALPYLLALLAAISWSVYSNLCLLWAGENNSAATPLFIIMTGLVFSLLSFFAHETANWNLNPVLPLIYMIIFPTLLAYAFWEVAMRKGNQVLVVTISYATPIVSTIFTCLVLQQKPGFTLWAGCILIVAGAFISKKSVKNS